MLRNVAQRSGRVAVVFGTLMSLVGCSSSAPAPEEKAPVEETAPTQEAVPHRGCATIEPSAAEKAEIEAAIAGHVQAKRAVGSVNVPVYVHVINQGAGIANGDI